MAPGRCGFNLKFVIPKLISRINILSIFNEIAIMWKPQDITND